MKKLFCLFVLVLSIAFSEEKVHVCLVMHVKDNGALISHSLMGCSHWIDCVWIEDPDATEDTLEEIQQFLHTSQIPVKISSQSPDRKETELLFNNREMRNFFKSQGFSLAKTYLLLIDSGMRLEISESLNKQSLVASSYLLLEKHPHLIRYSRRLLRADKMWKASEIFSEEGARFGEVHKLVGLNLINENYLDENKIHRLLDQLAIHPHDRGLVFDLAESYKNLKRYDEAIEKYKDRIELGGDPEEIWFSKYMIGQCFEDLKDWEQALQWYLEAYQTDPSRRESLQRISAHYRFTSQNDLAHIFAKYGSLLPDNQEKKLFDPQYSNYKFDEDLSIVSYYTRFRDDGYIAASDLLIQKGIPWWTRDLAAKNVLFYVKNIEPVRYQRIEIDLPLIEKGHSERYHPMNPSIVKTKEGFELICRAVNYTQKGAKNFQTIERDGIFQTINFFVSYDKEFHLVDQVRINEDFFKENSFQTSRVRGLEDCRLFQFEEEKWFTSTTWDVSPHGVPQIVLGRLGQFSPGDGIAIEDFIPLQGPDPSRCEKNWLPFVKDGQLLTIYSYDPFTVYRPDVDSGRCDLFLRYDPPADFSRLRGSAAPVEFDDGYLLLVHEVSFLEDESRVYLHRFLFLDADLRAKKISRPFIFKHQGVEFCTSMTWDHANKELVLPIGIEDHEAFLCFIDPRHIRSLLVDL